jgi:hypothetical protein
MSQSRSLTSPTVISSLRRVRRHTLPPPRETREKIAKAKNQRALNAKLQGSTLGDAAPDEDAESMAAWVKKSKKMQKQRAREIALARQREAEQAERDRAVYDEGEYEYEYGYP